MEDKNEKRYCKYCQKVIESGGAHIKRHSFSAMHNKGIDIIRKNVHITPYLKEERTPLMNVTKAAEYTLTALIVEHNLPMLIMDHLPKLLTAADRDLKVFKRMNCSRTKITKMIDVIEEEAVFEFKKILLNILL